MEVNPIFSCYTDLIRDAKNGDRKAQKNLLNECSKIAMPIFRKFKYYCKDHGIYWVDFDSILTIALAWILKYDNFEKITNFRSFFRKRIEFLIKDMIRKRRPYLDILIEDEYNYEEMVNSAHHYSREFYEEINEVKDMIDKRYQESIFDGVIDGKYSLTPSEYLIIDQLAEGLNNNRISSDLSWNYSKVKKTLFDATSKINVIYQDFLKQRTQKDVTNLVISDQCSYMSQVIV